MKFLIVNPTVRCIPQTGTIPESLMQIRSGVERSESARGVSFGGVSPRGRV